MMRDIKKMGLTKVTTKIISFQDPQQSYEAIFLVDTGATDSMVPAEELDKIGVLREGKMSYELANGTVKEYPFGLVRIEFMGETTAGRIIFGEPGSEPLLGVTVLESVRGRGIKAIRSTGRKSLSKPGHGLSQSLHALFDVLCGGGKRKANEVVGTGEHRLTGDTYLILGSEHNNRYV